MTRGTFIAVSLASIAFGAAGCHAALHGDFGFDAAVDPDASHAVDAAVADSPDGPPPLCTSGRIVFLNFDGVTLHKGTPSEAHTDTASWMGNATATIAAYDANMKAAVEPLVIAGLAQFPGITVHDQRPPSTVPYVEVVFGGTAAQINTPYDFSIASPDCSDAVKDDVAIVLNDVTNAQQAANYAIGAIGYGLGLTGVRDTGNCMCNWNVAQAVNCSTAACSLSSSEAFNTADHPCAGAANPTDQVAAFSAFCQ